jgi:hypothetical protein
MPYAAVDARTLRKDSRHQYRPINTYEQMPICMEEKEYEMETDNKPSFPDHSTPSQVESSKFKVVHG